METKWHYTREDMVAAVRQCGIEAGDIVSLQVSLGRLGLPKGASNYEEIANLVIDAFMEVLGSQGTLVVPTYTYSIGRGEVYEVETTPSSIGAFSEIFRKRAGVIRSRDPMLSSAGLGARATEVLLNISRSCYGEGSTFHRLREAGSKVCTLGVSLYWATFRHHIEEMANVPFRFKKLFTGQIKQNGEVRRESWVYYAAPFIENCAPMGLPLEIKAREVGLLRKAAVGRGELMCIGAQQYFEFGMDELKKNPWLTAQGPSCDLAEMVRLEDERVSGKKYSITLPQNATMSEMIDAIWYLPRDLVSEGYDAALMALATQIPITIHEHPTGTECWSWIIPEKWTCREAYLETMDGRRLFSYSDHMLHVPSYSWPFNGVVSREELFEHLTVHPVLKDATPYHYLFYRREWGLCCSQELKDTLMDEQYKVVIDAAFSYGILKNGETVIQGEIDDCVVICGQLDHPAQANDGLSGCIVGVEIMRELAKRKNLRYSYRLLLVPETIGSMAYLSHNQHLVPSMKGGIFLEMVGLDNSVIMQHSYNPTNAFDRCCLAVMAGMEPDFRTGRFLEVVTNDDRQFNAPGIRVPMVSLSRVTKPVGRDGTWLFDEYHSERDTPDGIFPARLEQTRDLVLAIIDAWEKNYIPVPLFTGEVFLSRYGIYYDFTVDSHYGQALFDVMHGLDGVRSVVDIAVDNQWPFDTVFHVVEQFRQAGLVEALSVQGVG